MGSLRIDGDIDHRGETDETLRFRRLSDVHRSTSDPLARSTRCITDTDNGIIALYVEALVGLCSRFAFRS